jgi:hypothetical protein
METLQPISRRRKIFRNSILAFCIFNQAFACISDIGCWAIVSGIPLILLSIVILIKALCSKASKRIAIASLIISLASIGTGYWTFTQIKFKFIIQPGWDSLIIKH